jgi:hypothetical protein
VVKFALRPLYPVGRLNRRLGGPQSWAARSEKKQFPVRTGVRNPERPAYSIFAIPPICLEGQSKITINLDRRSNLGGQYKRETAVADRIVRQNVLSLHMAIS